MKSLNTLAVLGFTLLFFSLSAWSQEITVDGLTYSLEGSEATVTGQVEGSQETNIVIPPSVVVNGVDYRVTAVAPASFCRDTEDDFGCDETELPKLTSVSLPQGLTEIGNAAFYENNLTSLVIPDTVTTIGSASFRKNQLATLVLGDGVALIGSYSFNSNALTSLTIPDSVITVGAWAFSFNKIASLTLGSRIETIDDAAFIFNHLTSTTIPNTVTELGYYAFAYNSLESLTLGQNLKTIGTGAFFTNRLTSVTVPKTVTTIRPGAFVNNSVETSPDSFEGTLSSITFAGPYYEFEIGIDEQGEENEDFGSGFSSKIFYNVGETPNSKLREITACPSASWSNVFFDVEDGVSIPVDQSAEACGFVDPVVLIDELSAFVADLNAKKGILNALDAKLGAVQGALSDLNENNDVAALNAMYAFCYNAQAQSGKQLETADADALIAKADAIIAAIDPDAALCSE
ncbi:leucine-rich repeat domain-containing protein [Luminiphilus sp.]|nr:leucine-rich repeat domain-containing protein [Luminiphilus sp.]